MLPSLGQETNTSRATSSFAEVFDAQVAEAKYSYPWYGRRDTQALRHTLVDARDNRSSRSFRNWKRRLTESLSGACAAPLCEGDQSPIVGARLAIQNAFVGEDPPPPPMNNRNCDENTVRLDRERHRSFIDVYTNMVDLAVYDTGRFRCSSNKELLEKLLDARSDRSGPKFAAMKDELEGCISDAFGTHDCNKQDNMGDAQARFAIYSAFCDDGGSAISSGNERSRESSLSAGSGSLGSGPSVILASQQPKPERPSVRRQPPLPTNSSADLSLALSPAEMTRSFMPATQSSSIAGTSALKEPRSPRRGNFHAHFAEDPVTDTIVVSNSSRQS